MSEYDASAVLPTGPAQDDGADPHRLLAAGEGLLVSWGSGSRSSDSASWGPALSGASGLARSLTEVVRRAGMGGVTSSAAHFRLEVPAGQTLLDLMPAVGGGFRGMTRSASGITGHARLLPAGDAAKAGAAVALGPLLGLMAVSVGAEMLARHQQEQQLNAIRQVAEAVLKRQKQQDVAMLQTAEDTIRTASAALLDKIRVPDAAGLGATASNLYSLRNRAAGWLGSWEQSVSSQASDDKGVNLNRMYQMMAGPLDSPEDFEASVALLQRTIALDSRMRILGAVEAATLNPATDLSHFRGEVATDLRRNAEALDRLREILLTFASYRITIGYPHRPKSASEAEWLAARLSRVAHAVVKTPSSLPLLNEQNRLVIETSRHQDGTWIVRKPAALHLVA